MNKLQALLFRAIVRNIMQGEQSYDHPIVEMFRIINKECQMVYYEDNKATINHHLRRLYYKAKEML